MPKNFSGFDVPSFARHEVYHFGTSKETLAVYQELNAIAEEIEQCRAKNS